MAQVQPEVLDLLPDETIKLNVRQGIGSSNNYSLAILLEIASSATIEVKIILVIREPTLYRFVGGTNTVALNFPNVQNGSIVEFPFAIRNEIPLTGAQLRMWVDANDVATGIPVLRDATNHNVVYS